MKVEEVVRADKESVQVKVLKVNMEAVEVKESIF